MSQYVTRIYHVHGMTCANCARHVEEEVLGVPGVIHTEVLLDRDELYVEGKDFTDAQVHAAIEEAGYALS